MLDNPRSTICPLFLTLPYSWKAGKLALEGIVIGRRSDGKLESRKREIEWGGATSGEGEGEDEGEGEGEGEGE
jgi:hypothetical protein